MSAARKRGPHKGDGGRPALRLYNDPDRKVIKAALWFWRTHEAQRSFEVLQMLDALFTPHDTIKLRPPSDQERWELARKCGAQLVDEKYKLVIENTAPSRAPDTRTHSDAGRNVAPDRRLLSAPDRKAFRKSRLQYLRAKVDYYRGKRLDDREERILYNL